MRRTDYLGLLLGFSIGLTAMFRFEFGGMLALNEILVIALLPACLGGICREFQLKYFRLVFGVGIAYFLSTILSDLYRGTLPVDYLRGWARICITLISMLSAIPLVLKDKDRTLAFVIGWFLAPILDIVLHPDSPAPFKFYIGPSVSAFAFILIGMIPRKLRPFAHVLLLAVAGLAFWQDSRSLAAITIAAQVMYLLSGWGGQASKVATRSKRLIFVALIFVALSCGVFEFYTFAAPRGVLGDIAQMKYERQILQSKSQSFSLLSGRKEIFFVWPKIEDSPWIGYGSWPKDWVYVQLKAKELGGINVADLVGLDYVDIGLIPTHSHFFGAWLEAGIIGAIFWFVIICLVIGLFVKGFNNIPPSLVPVFVYILITFSWDLFFSPYGAGRRYWNGFVIAWMIVGLSRSTMASNYSSRASVYVRTVPRRCLQEVKRLSFS